jgi:predicted RNase H-like HicB family nuclease
MKKYLDTKEALSHNRHRQGKSRKGKPMAREMKGNSITFSVDMCIEEDGEGFYAYCPALKGLHIDGSTREEALENLKTAVVLYIESLIKHGDAIPLNTVGDTPRETPRTVCSPQQRQTEDIRIAI